MKRMILSAEANTIKADLPTIDKWFSEHGLAYYKKYVRGDFANYTFYFISDEQAEDEISRGYKVDQKELDNYHAAIENGWLDIGAYGSEQQCAEVIRRLLLQSFPSYSIRIADGWGDADSFNFTVKLKKQR